MPRLLLFLLLLSLCSTTPPTPTITAAEAAKRPGEYVHVRARVARVFQARSGYVFLNLSQPRPNCPLEVVVAPDVVPNLTRHLRKRPTELAGRVVQVEGVVQAAEGSTAQIWLSRAPALSVAP
jgi:hypothetical protein